MYNNLVSVLVLAVVLANTSVVSAQMFGPPSILDNFRLDNKGLDTSGTDENGLVVDDVEANMAANPASRPALGAPVPASAPTTSAAPSSRTTAAPVPAASTAPRSQADLLAEIDQLRREKAAAERSLDEARGAQFPTQAEIDAEAKAAAAERKAVEALALARQEREKIDRDTAAHKATEATIAKLQSDLEAVKASKSTTSSCLTEDKFFRSQDKIVESFGKMLVLANAPIREELSGLRKDVREENAKVVAAVNNLAASIGSGLVGTGGDMKVLDTSRMVGNPNRVSDFGNVQFMSIDGKPVAQIGPGPLNLSLANFDATKSRLVIEPARATGCRGGRGGGRSSSGSGSSFVATSGTAGCGRGQLISDKPTVNIQNQNTQGGSSQMGPGTFGGGYTQPAPQVPVTYAAPPPQQSFFQPPQMFEQQPYYPQQQYYGGGGYGRRGYHHGRANWGGGGYRGGYGGGHRNYGTTPIFGGGGGGGVIRQAPPTTIPNPRQRGF